MTSTKHGLTNKPEQVIVRSEWDGRMLNQTSVCKHDSKLSIPKKKARTEAVFPFLLLLVDVHSQHSGAMELEKVCRRNFTLFEKSTYRHHTHFHGFSYPCNTLCTGEPRPVSHFSFNQPIQQCICYAKHEGIVDSKTSMQSRLH